MAAVSELDWPEIYHRLAADRADSPAWNALALQVRRWAERDARWNGAEEVEDAIAEVCVKAVVEFDRARGPETFIGFVYGQYLNLRPGTWRRPDPPEPPNPRPPDDAWDDEAAAQSGMVVGRLKTCFGELPALERRAIELRYFEGASGERIASELGLSIEDLRRVVFNGLARLRECCGWARP
jgi:RNA polymerase sigma factor (sigma-70 family)